MRDRTGPNNSNYRHGAALGGRPTSTYRIWAEMVQRCTNPRHKAWDRYGGRGITVCDAWLTFPGFLADMGERPAGLSLDRVDNDSGYRPDNCRWATASEQMKNRRWGGPQRDPVTGRWMSK